MQQIQPSVDLIGREARCSLWMATRRWLGPDVDLTAVGGLAQVRRWVGTGRGIALLPQFAVHADLGSQRLAQLDVKPPPPQLRLIWRDDHNDAIPLRHFLYALSQA